MSLRIVLFAFLLLLSVVSPAQRHPVSVTPILTPPLSTSLSSLAESGSTKLMVNIVVNDVTVSELPVRLHVKMESAGVTIESIPTAAVPPLLLGGGEARLLLGDDLAPYLRLDNLAFKGLSKSAYQKTGHLPAGLWKISVSVRHFHTGRAISGVGTAVAWLSSTRPPVLTSPKDGISAPADISMPLTFSWQSSKFTGGATAAIIYRLELWEMRAEGVPAQAVVSSLPPILSTETAGLTATVLPASLSMEPGGRYCWRVTAYDPAGRADIENGGHSEVRTFRYLDACPDVTGLAIGFKDDVTAYAHWDENPLHTGGYNVEVYDDGGTFHETLWDGVTHTCGIGGRHGQTWHVRVQGLCRGGVVGRWTDWADFCTPEETEPEGQKPDNPYKCGAPPAPRSITNFTPRESLLPGDTIETADGATKFVIRSSTRNDDGTYRGLSYMLLRVWGINVIGEYDHLTVNTDGVILGRLVWRSVPCYRSLPTPEAMEQWTDSLAMCIASATYNSTIRDTVLLATLPGNVRFQTIEREGKRYFALTADGRREEITSMIGGRTRTLVKDADGHELVIDKDGEVMGVEEYRACGGSRTLLRENIREKDSQVTASGNVKFLPADGRLFDSYDTYAASAPGYARRFPTIGSGDYRPAYVCAPSASNVKLKAEPSEGVTFKTGRGVPVPSKNGILSVRASGDRDTTSVFAYDADGHTLGKVNILSYDRVTRKLCLVPVGGAQPPDAAAAKAGLDKIFAKLMVDFDVTVAEPVSIEYTRGDAFTHGGSGRVGVYNADQRRAIAKLRERGVDGETAYLFLVDRCEALTGDDRPDVVSGYMPLGYQFGFIYNQLDNPRTMAHEISHGAFRLRHTFDPADFVAAEGVTGNLMDYSAGDSLNHWQWPDVHQPKSVRFKWLQDEEGAESRVVTPQWLIADDDMTGLFLTPSGYPLYLRLRKGSRFAVMTSEQVAGTDELPTFALYGFEVDGDRYFAEVSEGSFLGYMPTEGVGVGAEPYFDEGVTRGEVEAGPYGILLWDVESNTFERKEVDNNRWFGARDDWERYTASGSILASIDEYTFRPCGHLLRKYAGTVSMQSGIMRGVIESDPCVLEGKYMLRFADVCVPKSEWMKDFDLAFGVMLNVSLFPAEADLLFSMLGEGSTAWVKDLAVKLGENAVRELTRKAVMHYVKKDAKAFVRGAVSQFFVSSLLWAAEESEKGNRVTTEGYLDLLGIGTDVDVFNMKYENEARDFWAGVIQSGVANVVDNHIHIEEDDEFMAFVVMVMEGLDYPMIMSLLQDEESNAQQVIGVVVCEVIHKAVQSVIGGKFENISHVIGLGKIDDSTAAALLMVMYESMSKLISNATVVGLRLYVIDYDVKEGWQILDKTKEREQL